MNVEQRIENDRLNLKITLLEMSLTNLTVASRHLATEADEYLEERINTGSADAMVLADAITEINRLTSELPNLLKDQAS